MNRAFSWSKPRNRVQHYEQQIRENFMQATYGIGYIPYDENWCNNTLDYSSSHVQKMHTNYVKERTRTFDVLREFFFLKRIEQ